MADESDPPRDAIHEAIQLHMPRGQDAILTGWVIVAEWIDHNGERWLTKGHAASTSSWAANGMHHEALHGDWPDEPDDSSLDSRAADSIGESGSRPGLNRGGALQRDPLAVLVPVMLAVKPDSVSRQGTHHRTPQGKEVKAVGNITVGRYAKPAETGYQGWIEPDDRSWVAFVANDGTPVVFLNRDAQTGAVL